MDVLIEQASESTIRVLPHQQYHAPHIDPSSVLSDPLAQFRVWFSDAVAANVKEPEAMILSTATPTGLPSARAVLLKQVDARGFAFYTNYSSRKSTELQANPHAALVFYWREVHRSVRVVGVVERVTRQESAQYFSTRPLGSRLGAWASPQSQVVAEGEVTSRLQDVRARFGVEGDPADADIPLPEFWGGWRVVPTEVEFWAGQPSRLHDRVRYMRQGEPSSEEVDGDHAAMWKVDRLAP